MSDAQIKAARATIAALGVTNNFDNILPNLAERLKNTLIQASPNFQELITATVDEKALTLAARRADLENEAATIYAKTFTLEELNAITEFYKLDGRQEASERRPDCLARIVEGGRHLGSRRVARPQHRSHEVARRQGRHFGSATY